MNRVNDEARYEAWCQAAIESLAKDERLAPDNIKASVFTWPDTGKPDVMLYARRVWWRPWMRFLGINQWRFVKASSGRSAENPLPLGAA